MRIANVIILLAFILRTPARELVVNRMNHAKDLADNVAASMIGTLVDQRLGMSQLWHADLDNSMLGKHGRHIPAQPANAAADSTVSPGRFLKAEDTTADRAAGLDPYFKLSMDDIMSICKRRGFVFQSSAIYSGFSGFFDYGPLGVEVKNNIKKLWWKDFVHRREDVVGLDSSIICSPKVWRSSGHLSGFSDPMVKCEASGCKYRADHLHFADVVDETDGEVLGYVSVLESDDMEKEAMKKAKKLAKDKNKTGAKIRELRLRDMTEATDTELPLIPSPATGKAGSLSAPQNFNLMFATNVGPAANASATAYLRPETAQGIFINFKNVQDSTRVAIPFGIAQIGKAFRNEIAPQNFVFRSREFEQMEIEYFIPPGDEAFELYYNRWLEDSWAWLKKIGLREELMDREVHRDDKLAHYARACTDITFKFPFGQQELQGVAARGNYDLTQHQNGSGISLEFQNLSSPNKERFVPHCIEPSMGVDRLFLALICSAYVEDEVDGEKRYLLRFHPAIAPYKVAVFPIVKNKDVILTKAREVFNMLLTRYNTFWDIQGAIGRRYRRQDEIGTPFCVTIDFDTLQDDTVTVRYRDTTKQDRMRIDELLPFLAKEIDGY